MKKITCVYTGMGALTDIIESAFKTEVGETKFHHILDSGLIGDVIAADGVTPLIEKRLYALFDAAATTEPDIIVSTCSSIGNVTRKYASEHPELNILSIDYPMAKYAALNAKKVAVLATLSTTVEPSANLVKTLAEEAGRDVEIAKSSVPGAFEALQRGEKDKATELVVAAAKEFCSDADVILLAQASMSIFKPALIEALGEGAVLLESPTTCASYLKEIL